MRKSAKYSFLYNNLKLTPANNITGRQSSCSTGLKADIKSCWVLAGTGS